MVNEKKVSFWRELFRPYTDLRCIGGSPEYSGKKLTFYQGDERMTVEVGLLGELFKVITLDWQENLEKNRNLGKATAGAIAGALLTPGILVGAAIGGAIGGRQKVKDKSVAIIGLEDMKGNYIELNLQCTEIEFKQLSDMVRKGFN